MVKKADAELKIRHLAGVWARETGYVRKQGWYPSYAGFKTWLHGNSCSHYLNFRSEYGADHDAEQWFEDELRRWPFEA